MAETNVKSYQRRTSTGKVVTVRSHQREENDAVSEAVFVDPTRPAVSAKKGTFPGGRAVPGIFPTLPDIESMQAQLDEASVDVERASSLSDEILTALEDEESTPALSRLKAVLRGISAAGAAIQLSGTQGELLFLAQGAVKVRSHLRTLKSGKVVNVRMYTQIRDLVDALGGPDMAARKGVTRNLLKEALPDYDIDSVFDEMMSTTDTDLGDAPAAKDVTPGDSVEVDGKTFTKDSDSGLWTGEGIPVDDDEMDKKISTAKETKLKRAEAPEKTEAEVLRDLPTGTKVTAGDGSEFLKVGADSWDDPKSTTNEKKSSALLASQLRILSDGEYSVHEGNYEAKREYGSTLKTSITVSKASKVTAEQTEMLEQALNKALNHVPQSMASGLRVKVGGHGAPRANGVIGFVRTDMNHRAGGSKVGSAQEFPVMGFNPNYISDPEQIAKLYATGRSVKFFSPTPLLTPMEAVATHESAHYMEHALWWYAPYNITDKMYSKFNDAIDEATDGKSVGRVPGNGRLTFHAKAKMFSPNSRGRKALNTKLWREKLSTYGGTNGAELVAEAWAEYIGSPEPRPFAKAVGEALETAAAEMDEWLLSHGIDNIADMPEDLRDQTYAEDQKATNTDRRSYEGKMLSGRDRHGRLNRAYEALRNPTERDIGKTIEDFLPGAVVSVEGEGFGGAKYTITHPDLSAEFRMDEDEGVVDFEEIEVRQQGNGLGTKFVDAMEKMWKDEGFHKIQLRADKIGSYFWATKGYMFDKEYMSEYDVESLLDHADGLGADTSSLRTNFDDENWPTPAEIATLPEGLGRATMLNNVWHGIKVLNPKFDDFDDLDWDEVMEDDYAYSYMAAMSHSDRIGAALGVGDTEAIKESFDQLLKDVLDLDSHGIELRSTSQEFYMDDPDFAQRSYGAGFYKDGQVVGGFTRMFGVNNGVVEHSSFKMPKELRGNGNAQKINDAAEEAYAKAGFTRISLSAIGGDGFVGSYVWARAGFDWGPEYKENRKGFLQFADEYKELADPAIAEFVSEAADSIRDKYGDDAEKAYDAMQRDLLTTLDTHMVAMQAKDEFGGVELEDTPTPYELSDLGREWAMALGMDWWPGKRAMANHDGWEGSKDIVDIPSMRDEKLNEIEQVKNLMDSAQESPPQWNSSRWQKALSETVPMEEMDSSMREFSESLDSDEAEAWEEITTSGYAPINRFLREGDTISSEREAIIPVVDRLFDKEGTQLDSPTTVFRGGIPGFLEEGQEIEDPGFMSVSASASEARNFGRANIINLPKGTKIIPGNSVEREMILPRGTKLRVVSVFDDEHGNPVAVLEPAGAPRARPDAPELKLPSQKFNEWYTKINEWRRKARSGRVDSWVSSEDIAKALETIRKQMIPA